MTKAKYINLWYEEFHQLSRIKYHFVFKERLWIAIHMLRNKDTIKPELMNISE